jgi:hypothetical protein
MRINILSIDLLQPVSDFAVNPNPALGIKFLVHDFADERVRESVTTAPERRHDAGVRCLVQKAICHLGRNIRHVVTEIAFELISDCGCRG